MTANAAGEPPAAAGYPLDPANVYNAGSLLLGSWRCWGPDGLVNLLTQEEKEHIIYTEGRCGSGEPSRQALVGRHLRLSVSIMSARAR